MFYAYLGRSYPDIACREMRIRLKVVYYWENPHVEFSHIEEMQRTADQSSLTSYSRYSRYNASASSEVPIFPVSF